ncbi:MAG: hypothetical protein JW818_01745 [Pirellulales bacterium]|nr:hypothetical protein [Pirellulales bacterium]
MDTSSPISLPEAFRHFGDASESFGWPDGDPDYVAKFGLTPGHIPALIETAWLWVNEADLPDDETAWAPVHAWRALGQLQAVEAVEPLLKMMNPLDAGGDDWYVEEFFRVFGLIGPPAVPALTEYLKDRINEDFPRVAAAGGLCNIAQRFPEWREQVIETLAAQLRTPAANAYTLKGLLVGQLLDLEAVEAAETIERAYAEETVDETVCGDWEMVRRELGVEGLGLVPDRPKPDPHFRMPGFWGPDPFEPFQASPEERERRKRERKKLKAKQKQKKRSKKRNQVKK